MSARRANVVFLLHMHQPEYVDPRTRQNPFAWYHPVVPPAPYRVDGQP